MKLLLVFVSIFFATTVVLQTPQASGEFNRLAPKLSTVRSPQIKTQTDSFVVAAIQLFPGAIFPQSTVPETPQQNEPQTRQSKTPDQQSGNQIYRIQLASTPSDTLARQEWERLRTRHPQILSGLALIIEKADLGTKGTFYRVQAGPFQNAKEAQQRCAELVKQKARCLVVKPR